MTPLNCFICQTKCYFYQKNLNSIKTKHSKRPVTVFIRILSSKVSTAAFSKIGFEKSLSLESTALCYECLDKIDVYDLARSTVQDIENQMCKHLLRINPEAESHNATLDQPQTEKFIASDSNDGECSIRNEISMTENSNSQDEDSSNGFNFDDNVSNDDDDEESDNDIENMYTKESKVF